MHYEGSFWGMNLIWWFLWVMFMLWVFATPYRIPGQRYRRESALDILQRRFASGEITDQEYKEKKDLIIDNLEKPS